MNAINVKEITVMDVYKDAFKCIKNGFKKIRNFATSSAGHLFDIMFKYLYYHILFPAFSKVS